MIIAPPLRLEIARALAFAAVFSTVPPKTSIPPVPTMRIVDAPYETSEFSDVTFAVPDMVIFPLAL